MPTSFGLRTATRTGTLCECLSGPAWSQTLAKVLGHVRTLLVSREPGDLTVDQRRQTAVLVRIGKARSRTR